MVKEAIRFALNNFIKNIYLEPANENYKSILVNSETSIIGKVVKVVREYV